MMFRLPENSFSTRIFHSCPQVKLSPRFISSPPPPPSSPSQIQFPLQQKREGKLCERSDLSKVLFTRAYFRYRPFLTLLHFQTTKPFNTTLFRRISSSICPIFTNVYPFLIHTIYMPCLPKIYAALIYFAVLNGHQTSSEMVAYLISTDKFYKTLKVAI